VTALSRRRRGRLAALAAAAGLLLAISGCAQGSGNSGDVLDQGYQSGDGSVRTWAEADRTGPIALKGDDFSGKPVDTGDWLGDVVVVNTWYAACPPCRKEAPDLVAAAKRYQGSVHFVGINTTDEAGTAKAFERTFSVPYPSIADGDGHVIAALQGVVPIQAVPTTVVIDQQGKVAARVLGEVETSTLTALVDDVLDHDPDGAGASQGSTAPASPAAPASSGSAPSGAPADDAATPS